MSTLQKFVDLKEKVEEAQQKADRAQGAEEQVMKRLKSEFGCVSLSAKKKKASTLKRQKDEAEKAFETAVVKFEEKWQNELERNS